MKCLKQGETKILLINVPFFKDLVVMAFKCDSCGYKNNEIQSSTKLQDKGIKFTIKITKKEDLERMIVAGMKSLVYIPELDFEVPDISKGVISTVSGMIRIFREDLMMDQEARK